MQLTGMLYDGRLLNRVGFPTPEILGPDASEDDIQALINRHGLIFIKPLFRRGVGWACPITSSLRISRLSSRR